MKTSYTITGMTCGHCVAAVKEEVGAIEGVSSVAVELSGQMEVTSDVPIAFEDIVAAVNEAGEYQVAKA